MSLAATPALRALLYKAAVDFTENGVLSGSGVTEDNMATISHTSAQAACNKFADDVSAAIDTWLNAVVLECMPGAIITVGSPTTQSNATPAIVSKF